MVNTSSTGIKSANASARVPTLATAKASRILLTQLRRIGDVLMTTPAVEAMRKHFPHAEIIYLTEAPSQQVFHHNPHVDEVWLLPKSTWGKLAMLQKLRRKRFDLVVDFFGNPRSALLTRLTGAPRRIGFNFPGRAYAYTDPINLAEGMHYAAQDKAALLSPLGISVDGPLPRIYPGEEERAHAQRQLDQLGVKPGDFLVALCPVSRQPYKVWPAKHFAHLADILVERYQAKIMLFHGPGEDHFTDAVRLEMRHMALPEYPVPDLLQMAALMEKAHLYLGNDNGPRHFALAVGTPTVTVFGRPFPENWTPPGLKNHLAIAHDPGCKSRCAYPKCGMECINDLPHKPVQTAVETLLEEILKHGRPD